jgi:hypothetical protein
MIRGETRWHSFLSKSLATQGIGEQCGVKGGASSKIRVYKRLQNSHLSVVFDP